MAPIHGKRTTVETEKTAYEPSTWTVLATVGSAAFLTYGLWNSATRVWNWIQYKIHEHRMKSSVPKEQPVYLLKRDHQVTFRAEVR